MFDQVTNQDAVILEPSISALHAKIQGEKAQFETWLFGSTCHICRALMEHEIGTIS